ncbi:FAD linked oxidase [Macleaya cordata]|uniref:FAD linked oxidase n=1 Tax=Macleaya cordata TaxID=56857 RepID=A0A200Q0L8_MACCD|nr:FAD linked oxidase [Macleaya cordata]
MATSSSSASSSILVSILFSFLVFSISLGTSSSIHGNFLQCLSQQSQTSIPVYAPNNANYTSVLQSTIQNLRLLSSTTPKPNLIITPLHESHAQAAVICSRKHGIQIKIRSGGHDYDGLSYVSDVPFVIVDLTNLRSVTVDAENNTAWVQSGATIGEVYYNIGVTSRTLAFPAGICPTVGVGGHFSGGGYGSLLRMYGLAADNVIDARIVDVNGRILDKKSMGDDLFWAIRGGGGGSFGVVLSWKIRLVSVPPTVTVFTVAKTIEQGATELIHRWQEVAPKLPKELFIRVIIDVVNANQNGDKKIQASFNSMFLGGSENLLTLMKERFPELGLEREDCIEMSWVQSTLYFNGFPIDGPLDVLLSRAQPKRFYKAKSDYVQQPIPQIGLEGMWRRLLEEDQPVVIFSPYGGRMSEISESEIPFPHREGNLFKIQYLAYWEGLEETEKQLSWIRKLYRYMAPYVSKSPRAAYLNYRDIDIGQSKNGTATYLQGKVWGGKYFKSNYERLVHVKSKVDPENFFRNEQSIPSVA